MLVYIYLLLLFIFISNNSIQINPQNFYTANLRKFLKYLNSPSLYIAVNIEVVRMTTLEKWGFAWGFMIVLSITLFIHFYYSCYFNTQKTKFTLHQVIKKKKNVMELKLGEKVAL